MRVRSIFLKEAFEKGADLPEGSMVLAVVAENHSEYTGADDQWEDEIGYRIWYSLP